MKGFKKDGKFRPTGNKSKSSLKKSDVRKKETVSTTGADKLKTKHSAFEDDVPTKVEFELVKEYDEGFKLYYVEEVELDDPDNFYENWYELRNDEHDDYKDWQPKFEDLEKAKLVIEREIRHIEEDAKEKEWEEQGLVSWDEIEDGDLIDFGSYGRLYLINKHFQSHHDDQPQVRVTDLKSERYNKHASGWNMNLHDSAGFKVLEKANENDREYARGEEED